MGHVALLAFQGWASLLSEQSIPSFYLLHISPLSVQSHLHSRGAVAPQAPFQLPTDPQKSLCVCLCAEGWTRRRALAQSLRVSRLCLLVTGSPVEMVLNKPINYFSQHIFYSNSGKTYCYSVLSWLGPILAPGWPLQAHCCAAQHQLCRFISAQQIFASCRL